MLQINYRQGIYEVKGKLSAQNSKSLKMHFENLLNIKSELVISLDKLQNIDTSGINTIISLYKNALRDNKILYIIGKTDEHINNSIAKSKLKYIVKSDFI